MSSSSTNIVSLKLSYWCIFIGSLIVAIWCRFIDPVINPDGVKYVLASQAFLEGEFEKGFSYYKWPFYSLSVAAISYVTQLTTEYAALTFNFLMRVVAGLAFVRLVRNFNGTATQLLIAAFVFVLYPGLNEAQSMIIRDFAYLGCFMWMVVFFVQQLNNPATKNLLGFIVMGVFASAYRVEGLVYLLGLSFVHILWGKTNRPYRKLWIVIVLVVFPIFVYGALSWIYNGNVANAWTIITDMMDRSRVDVNDFVESLAPGVWPDLLTLTTPLILLVLPFYKLTINLLDVITIGYVSILAYGWFHCSAQQFRFKSTQSSALAWKWIVSINLLVLIGFVFMRQIVTDRYPLSLALMLMLLIPFILTDIFQRTKGTSKFKYRMVAAVFGAVLLINSAEGLDRVSSKLHMKEAGEWVRHQSGGYKKSWAYSNVRIVDYYTGKPVVEPEYKYSAKAINSLIFSTRWKLLRFLVIAIEGKNKPGFYRNLRFRIGKEPDKIFENGKGDKVLVYDFRLSREYEAQWKKKKPKKKKKVTLSQKVLW